MRKPIIIELIIFIICALMALVFAALLCNFTPSRDLSVKIFNIGTETSPRYMVLIFWLFSIFLIDSLRQIKLKFKSIITNIVLLLVSLKLIVFIEGRIESMNRIKTVLENQKSTDDSNSFLFLLWIVFIILLITIMVLLFSLQKVIRQKLEKRKTA
jgi:hypothetical protein